ncbi:MAG: glutamine amidotransferase, partial [Tepidisphaeraceae bacterium]
DAPQRPLAATLDVIKDSGVKLFPVPLGSDQAPPNIEIQSVSAQESAFKGDIVNVKVALRAAGLPAGKTVSLALKDKKTGVNLIGADGAPVEQTVTLANDTPTEVELQFRPDQVGTLDLLVEAARQTGEVDEDDNIRQLQVAVLDAKINVLYVDGYPRWEYRYIKNEMMRDRTIDISCLLTSADPTFRQEGDKPITRFPETIEEMMEYDVVLLGDVEPRQFSDAQLQLISEFVSKKGGGFGMIAGPQFSPQAWRNSAIEPILPVNIGKVLSDDPRVSIPQGFRPVLTKDGANSSMFRFFADKSRNERYLRDEIQPIFWYCKGVTAKNGVGEVFAEHPVETGPDGRKAALLVLGRFGAGRTLFSGIDDSWRWRYYTGESIFDTYWVQQLRYLARSKKLGQRRVTFTSVRPTWELGQQVRATLKVLDPQLIRQLPEQIRVDIRDASDQPVRQEMLVRQENQTDTYDLSFTAERAGRFVAKLPAIAAGVDPIDLPIEIAVPKLELTTPQSDRATLSRLATETLGQSVPADQARAALPRLITSAAKVIPVETSEPLWDAPLAMVLFVFLITGEWLLRKVYGML